MDKYALRRVFRFSLRVNAERWSTWNRFFFFAVRDYSKEVIKRSNDGDDGEITITQESKRLDIVINSVTLHW